MRRTLASLIAVLIILGAIPASAVATGDSKTSLNACTKKSAERFGGTKVFARDKAKGASRVLCPVITDAIVDDEDGVFAIGGRSDGNLNRRNRKQPKLGDIWNGFSRNIESFKLRAAAGCATGITLSNPKGKTLMERVLVNDGNKARSKRYEVPGKKDNKAVRVTVGVGCPVPDEASFPMYATGDIGCDGAKKKINNVGTAHLTGGDGELSWRVELTGAAANWDYYVEVQQDNGKCQTVLWTYPGFKTDGSGNGIFEDKLSLPAGRYLLNLDVVSESGVPPFAGHREIGGYGFREIGIR